MLSNVMPKKQIYMGILIILTLILTYVTLAQSAELPILKIIGTGPAETPTYATLPHGIAIASDGTIYLLNTVQGQIDVYSPSAPIGTGRVAQRLGTTASRSISLNMLEPQGIAVGPNGMIYVADTGNSQIRVTNAAGTVNTPLITTGLSVPRDIAVDLQTATTRSMIMINALSYWNHCRDKGAI
jgi:hypothetical protein